MAIPPPPGPQQPEGPYPPPGTPPGAQGTPGAFPPPYPHVPDPRGPYQGGPHQQSPYGPPYQPWGQGYSPYNRPVPVNGLAIAALVLGILCFVPAVGLVLGIVALVQIKKRGERGKGMAVGGMVMSSIGIGLLALVVATGGARDFWDGFQGAANDSGSAAFSLEVGECFDSLNGSLRGLAFDVDKVPCSGEHEAEVFAEFAMGDGDYPGDSVLADEADRRCYREQSGYAMDSWAVPDNVDVYSFTPTSQSWRRGDREVSCLFGNTDERGSLTGSLRNDQLTLDPDQYSYLSSARAINNVLAGAPEAESVEDDLPGYKKWAASVSEIVAWQADGLPVRTFAPAARGPVAALVKDMTLSAKEWAKASDARDADAFYAHYEKAAKLIDPRKTVTTRKALGLATTPPKYDEGDTSGGGGEGGAGIEV
ncbi:DUF4190 domain-containing protein [Streptomyces sp. NBC_00638]|nr:DUF4190 domain-containing protein [Streptomyces sp. NBC_00568]MCX5006081.1 DUF4190 domain-containing protein [Streptomyces sp. NBC_00638]